MRSKILSSQLNSTAQDHESRLIINAKAILDRHNNNIFIIYDLRNGDEDENILEKSL